jgi:hypothetical protein
MKNKMNLPGFMNMPKFTAESSLYKSNELSIRRMDSSSGFSGEQIIPQGIFSWFFDEVLSPLADFIESNRSFLCGAAAGGGCAWLSAYDGKAYQDCKNGLYNHCMGN